MPELTAEEAHAQARERARVLKLTRLRATLDEIARARAVPVIQAIVDRLVRDGSDVPVRILPTVRDRLPEICRDRSIAQVAPMIVDVHIEHAMTRDELGAWIQYLTMLGKDLHAKGWPSPPPPPPQPPMRIMRGGTDGIVKEFELAPLPPIEPLLPPTQPMERVTVPETVWRESVPGRGLMDQFPLRPLPPGVPLLPPRTPIPEEDIGPLFDLAP